MSVKYDNKPNMAKDTIILLQPQKWNSISIFRTHLFSTLKIEFSKALAIDVAAAVNVLYSNMYIELWNQRGRKPFSNSKERRRSTH